LLQDTVDPEVMSQKLKKLIETQAKIMNTEDFDYEQSIREKEN